jgi:hypothetical protein
MPINPRNLSATGNITTNAGGPGNTVGLDAHGYGAAGWQVTGTWTGTLTFEGTVDGTNYAAMAATPVVGGSSVSTTTANGAWRSNIAGLQAIRLRGTASMTGTAVVTVIASLMGAGGV